MKRRGYDELFQRYFKPITWMKRRYPKAAKKRRIIKKWINRFGPEIDFEDLMKQESLVFKSIKKHPSWQGAEINIPEFK